MKIDGRWLKTPYLLTLLRQNQPGHLFLLQNVPTQSLHWQVCHLKQYPPHQQLNPSQLLHLEHYLADFFKVSGSLTIQISEDNSIVPHDHHTVSAATQG